MLAYYVHHLNPFLIEFSDGFGVRWYGTAYALAFLAAYQVLCWFSRRGYLQLPVANVADFVTGTALFGVLIGGRLGYALFYRPDMLLHPLELLRVWEGGMASHGGILGIVLYTLWYARRHRVSWLGLGDNLVVAAPIGLFLGRIANFINGELYGRVTTVPWAVQFPKELLDGDPLLAEKAWANPLLAKESLEGMTAAAQTSEPVRAALATVLNPRHPSQIYEALLEGAFLFVALWLIRVKTKAPQGATTGAFFILYAVVRILGEQFREPDASLILGITRGQFFSLWMLLIGAGFLLYAWKRNAAGTPPN